MICVLSHSNGSIPIKYIPMHFRIGNWPFSKLPVNCAEIHQTEFVCKLSYI